MTPTKHSEEIPIATECLDSSAKIASKSAKAEDLMVADMLAQMVRPCLWHCLCSLGFPISNWRGLFIPLSNFVVSDMFATLVSCCFSFYRKKTFENLAIRSWIEWEKWVRKWTPLNKVSWCKRWWLWWWCSRLWLQQRYCDSHQIEI